MKSGGLALILALILAGCRPSGLTVSPATPAPPPGRTAISQPLRGPEPSSEQPAVAPAISSSDALRYSGQTRKVCGPVVETRYVRSRGRPTYMYFDKPQPDNTFLVLIWGADRRKFPENPEAYYRGKSVCVEGKIRDHSSGPFTEAKNPSQISLR